MVIRERRAGSTTERVDRGRIKVSALAHRPAPAARSLPAAPAIESAIADKQVRTRRRAWRECATLDPDNKPCPPDHGEHDDEED
jgi:hypothetical protein